jgi:hypothetical protein
MSEELEKKQDNRETKISNREDLFEQILAISDRKLILHCVRIIFECSVEDGLILMEKLKLGNEELVKIIASPSFIIKHREVFSGVADKIKPKKAQQKISANSKKKALADIIIDRDKQLKKAEKAEDWEEFTEELEAERDSLPQAEVVKKITNYYAPFLKTRKFAPKDVAPDKNYPRGEEVTGLGGETRRLRSSEQVADEALSQYALMLNGAHYIASVKNILTKYLKENNLSGEPNFSADELFVTKDVIEQECDRLNIPFVGVESRLKTARYSSFSAGVGRVEAEKGILKKLNEALKEKGKKAELVGDKYEIVDDEKAEKVEKKGKGFEEKILDYLESLEIDEKNVYEITKALTGIESPRADKLRKKVLEYVDFDNLVYKEEVDFGYPAIAGDIAKGLVGLDTDESWQIRQKVYDELILFIKQRKQKKSFNLENSIYALSRGLFAGLAGINSERAQKMRDNLFEVNRDTGFYISSIAGIDTDKAWQNRNEYLKLFSPGFEAQFFEDYLIGLDSDEAWRMRDKIFREIRDIENKSMRDSALLNQRKSCIAGLIGLESERAWQMREEALEEILDETLRFDDPFVEPLLKSLFGLTSERSMDMRRRLSEKGIDIYYTLVGNDLEYICDTWQKITGFDVDIDFKRNGVSAEFLTMFEKRNEVAFELKILEVVKGEKKVEEKEFDFEKFEEKALDYIEKLLSDGADKDWVVQGLAGLDSDRAWTMRERLFNEISNKGLIAIGLAGLDSDRAWAMRERFFKEGAAKRYDVVDGLAGLDSDRAWAMREELLKKISNKGWVTECLAGLDSDRAWAMREELLSDGADKSSVAVGLSGLDSERAWEMRERLLKEGVDKYYVAAGLAGLDSDRAWAMRERLLKEGADKSFVAIGLAGLDSDRAWAMREELLSDGADKGYVAMGLAGLDSDRAWTMRKELLNEGVFKHSVAIGLVGDYKTFVWQLKLKEKQQQQKLLNEEEKKLALINLLHNPNLEGISRHFGGTKSEVEEALKRKRESGRLLAESFKFTNFLNKLINRDPQLFLNDISAKKDRLTHLFVERLVDRIFPETKEREGNWRGFSGYSGIESGRGINRADPENYLQPGFGSEFFGGGAEGLNDNREIMEFRDPPNGIVVTGIYGDYNANSKNWNKIEFPLDAPITELVKEITATIPNVKNLNQVILPKPLEAKIIPERVKGFDAGGNEFDLQVEINKLGEVTVINKPKQVEKIAYSISVSTLPPPLEDLSQKDYNLYRQHLEVSNGRELTNSISTLPEDLELQLAEAIKDKSPKEQVIAIERLVRDLGYYDVNNQEVNQLKSGKSLEEQLYIMEQRLEELRQTNPDSDEYKGKRFAGVCADFAKITAMLLRRAGFASGMISGFGGQEKVVRVKHAHATAFVLWPDAEGRNRVISIDGTPDGLTGISTLSLIEKEVEAIKNERELSVEAIKEVEQIIKDLNNLDVESVRKMSNGELERVLNNILKYQVKESHLAIIERLFDYYWYTPVHELDLDNPYQQSEAVLELASAVERQRKRLIAQPEQDQTPAGNKLMQTMQEFLRRFETAGATEDKDSGLRLMEKIVELVQNDLSDLEKKSAYAVIAYLKAKNILGDKG